MQGKVPTPTKVSATVRPPASKKLASPLLAIGILRWNAFRLRQFFDNILRNYAANFSKNAISWTIKGTWEFRVPLVPRIYDVARPVAMDL